MVPENLIVAFLKAFFATMDFRLVKIRVEDCKVHGTAEYNQIPELIDEPDEEMQDFMWDLCTEPFPQSKVKDLCDYLAENKLVDIDMITISEDELVKRVVDHIGWSTEDATVVIDELMEVYIRMVDDGELTDAFFLHF